MESSSPSPASLTFPVPPAVVTTPPPQPSSTPPPQPSSSPPPLANSPPPDRSTASPSAQPNDNPPPPAIPTSSSPPPQPSPTGAAPPPLPSPSPTLSQPPPSRPPPSVGTSLPMVPTASPPPPLPTVSPPPSLSPPPPSSPPPPFPPPSSLSPPFSVPPPSTVANPPPMTPSSGSPQVSSAPPPSSPNPLVRSPPQLPEPPTKSPPPPSPPPPKVLPPERPKPPTHSASPAHPPPEPSSENSPPPLPSRKAPEKLPLPPPASSETPPPAPPADPPHSTPTKPSSPILTPPEVSGPSSNQTIPTPSSSQLPPPKAGIIPPHPHLTPPNSSLSQPQIPSLPAENPATNSSPSAPETSSSSSSGGNHTTLAVAISVGVGLVFLACIAILVYLKKRKRGASGLNGGYVMPSPPQSSQRGDSPTSKTNSSAPLVGGSPGSDVVYVPPEPGGSGNARSCFTYDELLKATNGFSHQNLLGEGGFGFVYRGYLADGREIAVKQLKVGGGQGEREFKAEVEIISRVHHRHLVSLVGYCISSSRRLLVYDYMPNNNLYFHLHESSTIMDWETRLKVAAGAARGLAYLHEDCHPRIIHRDIKSSNILLNKSFEAQVSDFGLAKLALDLNTHVSTRVMGTFGYMAPEYASSGKLSEKSDVYSFGVVLLELITGRKPVDTSQPLGDESLVEWARPLLVRALASEGFQDLVDPRLGKNYVESEMFQMIEAAAACVRHSAARRPRMGQVVRAFDGIANSDLTNGMKLGESEIHDSAFQSAEIRMFQRMAFGAQDYSTGFLNESSSNELV